MWRLFVPIVIVALCASASQAAVISDHADDIAVTIYHDNETNSARLDELGKYPYGGSVGIAFITETRTVDIPAGPSEIEFRNVTSTIVPQSADIQGLPEGVLERNFDYDLLTPGTLLAKSIGETVTIVRTEGGKRVERKALVRSGPNGAFLDIDGSLEALRCSGLPEALIFSKIPQGLRDSPTLTIRTKARSAGRYTLKLSYIATGLNWSADYIAHIRPDGRSLDLNGWLTLANFSETSFRHAPIQVVAGKAMSTGEDTSVRPPKTPIVPACWPTDIDWAKRNALWMRLHGRGFPQQGLYAPSPVTAVGQQEFDVAVGSQIIAGDLGDYKIYQLPELADVAARQTKQVQFLSLDNIPFERGYFYLIDPTSAGDHADTARSIIELKNTVADGLGKPLPSGTVSVVRQATNGIPILEGQEDVHDTPVGLPLDIETGKAINVRIEQHLLNEQEVTSGKEKRARKSFEIIVENGKSIPISFELLFALYGGVQLVDEDRQHIAQPNGMSWKIPLAAGQMAATRITIEAPK
jgi:hypothetical protein